MAGIRVLGFYESISIKCQTTYLFLAVLSSNFALFKVPIEKAASSSIFDSILDKRYLWVDKLDKTDSRARTEGRIASGSYFYACSGLRLKTFCP